MVMSSLDAGAALCPEPAGGPPRHGLRPRLLGIKTSYLLDLIPTIVWDESGAMRRKSPKLHPARLRRCVGAQPRPAGRGRKADRAPSVDAVPEARPPFDDSDPALPPRLEVTA